MTSQLISTPVGKLQAVWSPLGKLQSCGFLGTAPDSPQLSQPTSLTQPQRWLADRLELYFRSGHLEWDLELLDWTAIAPFHQRVLRACYHIPVGETLSYAALAAQAGSPRGARAVGSAMARNRWPVLIPCHRVVGAQGQLTGYSGAGGIETKRWLLELESRQFAMNT